MAGAIVYFVIKKKKLKEEKTSEQELSKTDVIADTQVLQQINSNESKPVTDEVELVKKVKENTKEEVK